jgi:hypothetical protein
VNFDTLERPDPESHEGMNAYFQTKVANILTGIELSKRSKGKINAYSLHPGGMSRASLTQVLNTYGFIDQLLTQI